MVQLYRSLNPPLLRYLRHRAPEGAEDLGSECWLAASKVLGAFEGDADDLRAWLFGVARRQVANYWRERRRRPREVQDGDVTDLPSSWDIGDVVVEAISVQAAIEALLRGLSEDQAEVVLLRVVAGLSVEQVANLLDKRPGTVRVVQHRALRRLAKSVERNPVTP